MLIETCDSGSAIDHIIWYIHNYWTKLGFAIGLNGINQSMRMSYKDNNSLLNTLTITGNE